MLCFILIAILKLQNNLMDVCSSCFSRSSTPKYSLVMWFKDMFGVQALTSTSSTKASLGLRFGCFLACKRIS
jgi:hypothetical protein